MLARDRWSRSLLLLLLFLLLFSFETALFRVMFPAAGKLGFAVDGYGRGKEGRKGKVCLLVADSFCSRQR
ncbi:unnamed protein product [Linum tenue]|uniref:Secreted protein n=1 Tax=Linum tenue TaxID=586396 RepID=A0AAV0L498_9ROSI|nr:unnamed protein product [Linum tenue]